MFAVALWAQVTAQVDRPKLTMGDSVTYSITASGGSVKFPELTDIGGFRIEQRSQSQQTQIINGQMSRSVTQSYSFTPTKDVQIPAYDVQVDGKILKTNPIAIKVKPPSATQDSRFRFTMSTDKKTAYVGEQVSLMLSFEWDANVDLMDLTEYVPSPFEHFWAKEVGNEKTFRKGSKNYKQLQYVIFPQKAGELTIGRASIKAGVATKQRDIFGFFAKHPKYQRVFSNELKINALPVPGGVRLAGDFEIRARVDKDSVKSGDPVNLMVEIEGRGNMDDIDDVTLDIPGATVYADKPERTFTIENGRYGGTYRRSFAIVGSQDFTIPSFSLRYFDLNRKEVMAKTTDSISVKVVGGKAIPSPQVEVKKSTGEQKSEDQELTKANGESPSTSLALGQKLLFLIVGFGWGIFVSFVVMQMQRRKRPSSKSVDLPIKQRIQQAKTNRELLQILMGVPSPRKEIEVIISDLEKAVYQGAEYHADKKKIIEMLSEPEEKEVIL